MNFVESHVGKANGWEVIPLHEQFALQNILPHHTLAVMIRMISTMCVRCNAMICSEWVPCVPCTNILTHLSCLSRSPPGRSNCPLSYCLLAWFASKVGIPRNAWMERMDEWARNRLTNPWFGWSWLEGICCMLWLPASENHICWLLLIRHPSNPPF